MLKAGEVTALFAIIVFFNLSSSNLFFFPHNKGLPFASTPPAHL